MSVDFALLKRPAGKAPRLKALPSGNYTGVIKSYEPGTSKSGTQFVRFNLGLTDWPDSVSEDDRFQTTGDGRREMIDLSKRPQRRDFFLTDTALYRLDKFLQSTGVDMEGRDYESVIPDVIGASVVVALGTYTNEKTGEIGNQVEEITGAA